MKKLVAQPLLFAVMLMICAVAFGSDLAKIPVREVTIFKDGHSFVLHEGMLPVRGDSSVVLDALPSPVLGTFWPYSAEKGATIHSVVAGQKRVQTQRSPLHLAEFVEANTGGEVIITEKVPGADKDAPRYAATLIGVPQRSAVEIEAASPPGSGLKLPEKGSTVLLRTVDGVKVLPMDRILDITLKGDARKSLQCEELRTGLTMRLGWSGQPAAEARVGIAYLQKGLRWIPSYRVDLDRSGGASVKLQATLVNDLTDIENAAANLVIGVPSFAFQGQVDPVALEKEAARLSSYMDPGSQSYNALSNLAISTQTARPLGYAVGNEQDLQVEQAAPEGVKAEDLYIFTVRGVSLKKGERMVLPVSEFSFKYKDVFTLDIPALLPPEMTQQRQLSGRESEIAKLMATPKAMHKIRWTNTAKEPLTTAPALVFSEGRLLAQGLMTYAAPGAEEELEVTAAVDVAVKKTESELRRIPNAATWNGDQYMKVELKGSISITNRRSTPVSLEVARKVLGNVDTCSGGGAIKKLNRLEEGEDGSQPWWSWYSWPYWWSHFNGLGSITWKIELEPGKSADLDYTWHYYWR